MARISLIEMEQAEAAAKRMMETLQKQFGVVIDPVKALAHNPISCVPFSASQLLPMDPAASTRASKKF